MTPIQIERVYIVRHGETDYNATGRWQGCLDIPLNDQGRRQAAQLAAFLLANGEAVDCVYSSDLARAHETAKIVAQAYGLEALTELRLRETNVGIFQGLTNTEIDELYGEIRHEWHHDENYVIPNGESRRQVQQRMMSAWNEWTAQLPVRNLMIVSHGGSIRWLLRGLFPNLNHDSYHLPNTSLTVVQRHESGWWLDRVGTTAHLTHTPSSASGPLKSL